MAGGAGPVFVGPFLPKIIFIFVVIIFIKSILGIPLLIMIKENMVNIFDVRNYVQQLTDAEWALLNEAVVKWTLIMPAKIAYHE